jgi:ribosomal protein S18 acetylase RimI-like enzyme
VAIHSFPSDDIRVQRLGQDELVETFGFLDRDPVLNVYLIALLLRDALARSQDTYLGVRRDGLLTGIVFMGGRSGAVLPAGDDPGGLERLGEEARARMTSLPSRFQVIGAAQAVSPFLDGFAMRAGHARLDRDQIYMMLERGRLAPFEPLPGLRPASGEDRAIVHASGAELRAEELEEDPRVTDPAGYARRVEEECRDGHTFLWRDEGGLCFRASVSARTADAAQVSGVYVPLARRNQGFARRGVGELCGRLLERSRTVALFVNDFNAPAIAVYERLGFQRLAPWRSVFFDLQRDPFAGA